MKKVQGLLASMVLLSFCLAAVAVASPLDNMDKSSYYALLQNAKQLYMTGGELTDLQHEILVKEGVIRPANTGELDETGGPDGYDYYYIDSAEDDGPTYSWIDITDSGTEITLGDDDSEEVDLQFTFTFYEEDYTSVHIGSNGFLSFEGNGTTDYSNDPIPTAAIPNGIFAPFWDDLDPSSGGEIWYGETTIDDQDAFVVSFIEVPPFFGDPDEWVTFQAILFEDGSMISQIDEYGADWAGNSCTIGTENQDGTDGLEYRYNDDPDAETAVMFYHEAPEGINLYVTDVSIDPNPVGPGDDVTVEVTIFNHGVDDAGAFDVEWFYAEDTEPSMGDVGDHTWTVASLDAMEETTVTSTTSYDELGAYDMYFIVNTDEAVTESDYTDNVHGPETVSVELPGVYGLEGEVNATGLVTLSWLEAGAVADYPGFTYDPEDNWTQESNVVTFTGTELNAWASGTDLDTDYDDHVIEATVARLDGSLGSSIALFTRANGYQDDDFSGYLFLLSANGSYGVAWLDGPDFGWFSGNGWQASDAINTGLDAVNTMTVAMDGYSGTYYINGTEVNSFTDADERFDSGTFGIATHDATGYDNVVEWTGCTISSNAALAAALTHEENAVIGDNDSDAPLTVSTVPARDNAPVEPRGFLNGFTLDELDEFLGYNVYRDDVMIEENLDDTTTTDQLDTFGEYEYYVTAEYTEGETDPSNTVTIIYTNPESVVGTVTECTDGGAAMEGVAVYADDALVATTDANGEYNAAVDPGTYDFTFVMDGYIDTEITDVEITGESVTVDAAMLYPEGDMSMQDIQITVDITKDEGDSVGTATISLDNLGCGPLNWSAFLDVIEQPFADPEMAASSNQGSGVRMKRHSTINLNRDETPELQRGPINVTSDELDDLWDPWNDMTWDMSVDDFVGPTGALVLSDRVITCEWSNFGYFEIDIATGDFIVNTTLPSPLQGTRDFEWDGEYIYGSNLNNGGNIYRWLPGDMENYELVTDAGTLGRGIAYDPATGDFYLSNWDALEKLSPNGQGGYDLTTVPLPAGPASMYGIGWMPDEPNGRNLMLFCQLDPDGDANANSTMFFMSPDGQDVDGGYMVYDDIDAGGGISGGVAVTDDYDPNWYLIATMCQGVSIDLWEGYQKAPAWLYLDVPEGTLGPDDDPTEITITANLTSEYLGFVPEFTTDMGAGELFFEGQVWEGAGPINVIVTLQDNDVAEQQTMPTSYTLHQNYPNPFNPTTQIRFDLVESQIVKLSVFNVLGQEVMTLANRQMDAGRHAVTFDAANLASGLYFYRIEAGQFTDMKKMILMK